MNARAFRAEFLQGCRAMLPICVAAIPAALAFTIGAREAGLSGGETMLMSLAIFAAGVQLSAIGLLQADTPGLLIVLTAALLASYSLLFGLSLGAKLSLSWRARAVVAFFLTDAAYVITVARQGTTLAFLLGAELAMYATWNLCTLLGVAFGSRIPVSFQAELGIVYPLMLVVIIVPILRTRAELVAVVVAGGIALAVTPIAPAGVAVLAASLVGSAAGGGWSALLGALRLPRPHAQPQPRREPS